MTATDTPSPRRLVTKAALIEAGAFPRMTPGERLIARFCDAVERGTQPKTSDLQAIAAALVHLLDPGEGQNARRDSLERMAATLRLTKKQGRQPETFGSIEPAVQSVVRYLRKVEQLRNAGRENPETLAVQAIARQEKLTPRAFRSRIEKHRESALLCLRFSDYLEAQNKEANSGK